MAQKADDIRHDIEDTRAAMTAKLAILEERVLETVAGAQASVEKIMEDVGAVVTDVRGTVEDVGAIVTNVRATVDTTLCSSKRGADIERQASTAAAAYAAGREKRVWTLPLPLNLATNANGALRGSLSQGAQGGRQ
jgi:hypothetical protein